MSIDKTLAERGQTHGPFEVTATISQLLTENIHTTPNWHRLSAVQREALEMIVHKIARVLVGDHNLIDSYRDIIGYTQLVINDLSSQPENVRDVATRRLERRNGEWVEV